MDIWLGNYRLLRTKSLVVFFLWVTFCFWAYTNLYEELIILCGLILLGLLKKYPYLKTERRVRVLEEERKFRIVKGKKTIEIDMDEVEDVHLEDLGYARKWFGPAGYRLFVTTVDQKYHFDSLPIATEDKRYKDIIKLQQLLEDSISKKSNINFKFTANVIDNTGMNSISKNSNINFKCGTCEKYVHMRKEVSHGFSDWAYDCGEWSDFDKEVPELSQEYWTRSDKVPAVGESRSIFVTNPFDEAIGNKFYMLYEPALIHFNGWEEDSDDIRKCAIVYCEFERVLLSDEYGAWIRVKVEKVYLLHELCEIFQAVKINGPIDALDGLFDKVYFQNDRWLIMGWTGQDDVGEINWIYTDDDGERHLVMMLEYSFHVSTLSIGNVVSSGLQ